MIKKYLNTDPLKHFYVVLFFVLVSILFFSPILEGKKILQPDIINYTAMSKELNDFRVDND